MRSCVIATTGGGWQITDRPRADTTSRHTQPQETPSTRGESWGFAPTDIDGKRGFGVQRNRRCKLSQMIDKMRLIDLLRIDGVSSSVP